MRENRENIGIMGISRFGRPVAVLISAGLGRSSEPRVGGSSPSECVENGVLWLLEAGEVFLFRLKHLQGHGLDLSGG